MALDENKIRKVLTHEFVTGSSIQNFDDLIDKLLDNIHDEINKEPIYNGNMYFLTMKDQYDKNEILRINCGVIFSVNYGPYNTTIHFIPYDWFSGNINDIIVQCITKEGE